MGVAIIEWEIYSDESVLGKIWVEQEEKQGFLGNWFEVEKLDNGIIDFFDLFHLFSAMNMSISERLCLCLWIPYRYWMHEGKYKY